MSIDNRGKPFTSKFKVWVAPMQVIPSGVWTQCNFNTVVFDLLNEYDEAVLFQFSPLEAGYYLIESGIQYANLVLGDTWINRIMINAAAWGFTVALSGAILNWTLQNRLIALLTPNDVVTVETWHNNGANRNLASNQALAWFAGFRMG